MRNHCSAAEITNNADSALDNPARQYRFDISQACVQILLQTYPDIGLFYDFMAHNAAMLGQEEQAVQSIAKALELEPNNVHFRSNQGWIHYMSMLPDMIFSGVFEGQIDRSSGRFLIHKKEAAYVSGAFAEKKKYSGLYGQTR